VKTVLGTLEYTLARRVAGDDDAIRGAKLPSNARLVEDWDGRTMALFESEWSLRLAGEWNPGLTFAPYGAGDLAAVS
jgi:peptide subunit release factor RF-3